MIVAWSRIRWYVGILTLVLVLPQSVAAEEKFDPFHVEEARVRRDVHTIALSALTVPAGTSDVSEARRRFDAAIGAELEAGGFKTVPSAEYGRVWHGMSVRLGGVFDTITGAPNDAKLDACREHTARELQIAHDVDAVLVTWISYDTTQVGVTPSDAAVGAISDPYIACGEPLTWRGQQLEALLRNLPQRVVATYFNAALLDVSGEELYSAQACLRWTTIYLAGSYEERQGAPWFGSDKRNQKAVHTVLERLTRRSASAVRRQ
jgi:hypothetical protein